MPVQKDILGDTTRPKKLRTSLTFMAAVLAVFSFAAPALAATAVNCVVQAGYVADCTYTGKDTGTTLYWQFRLVTVAGGDSGLIDSGYTASAEPDGSQAGIPLTYGGYYCNGGDPSDTEHIGLYESDLTTLAAGGTIDCTTNTWTPDAGGGAGLTFDPTAANGALSSLASGAQDIFWDSVGNVLLIVASLGITFSLFYLIYRHLKRRR